MAGALTDSSRRNGASSVDGPIGVIDIGSNSIRLVIYDRLVRSPVALFNEKSLCAIGRNMVKTGVLDEEGSAQALVALARFREVAAAVGVKRLESVATAAVRDAKNGNEFIVRAREALASPIRILSGEEEAKFAAEGVLAAFPDAEGVVGDLGGGSLELAHVSGGAQSLGITLPFGPLRLMDMCDGKVERARQLIDEGLERVEGIERLKGKALYAVGGVWRNIARVHMEDSAHPIKVLHHYEIARDKALDLTQFISGLSRKSLESTGSITRKRAEAIPFGAVVMERLLKVAKLDRVVISAFGVREGVLFAKLPPAERAKDPLIAFCDDMSQRLGREPTLGRVLERWTQPLFPAAGKSFDRLRRAACHLADTGWRGHPDHRADLMFSEVLNAPFIGIDHHGRSTLALAMFHRYGGNDEKFIKRIERLIGDEEAHTAKTLGRALRAALVLAGPSPNMLNETSVRLTPNSLILSIPKAHQALVGETSSKRLEALASALERTFKLEAK